MNITDFLYARLDDDEQTARSATPGPWSTMGQRVLDSSPPSDRLGVGMADGHAAASADYNETAAHIARHDPARVLREVEAKRELLKLHAPVPVNFGDEYRCTECARARSEHCSTLRLLALPYAGHPDFNPDWRL